MDTESIQQERVELITPGLSWDGLVANYNLIQKKDMDYEKMLRTGGYLGPSMTADTLLEHFPQESKSDVHVLDVGAGTGLVGEELSKLGFSTIDGIEPVASMAQPARDKGVYRKIYPFIVSGEKTPLSADSYDALVTCGTFVENHLPVESLNEFIRLVKQGGVIVICTRWKFLQTAPSLRGRLEPLMTSLEVEQRWKLVSRRLLPDYWLGDQGIVWTFVVCKKRISNNDYRNEHKETKVV